ncbi:aspartyl-phosphate phosphatase Spo0E family protein [Saccharibacillus alkalitolerans]|nr:aspartyl-phosphate phosphatase Spo0E family protein [Saccharibacillus alkalitolerans]
MAAASFQRPIHEHAAVRSGSQRGSDVPGHAADRERLLQEEIRALRALMEETFRRERSFTAAAVVDISSRLDLKINEYMQLSRS